MSRNQNIVIDLDATLVHTFDDDNWDLLERIRIEQNPQLVTRIYVLDYVSESKRNKSWGVIRPYTIEFLQFCIERFDKVIIWSAGVHSYVHNIVDILFNGLPKKPDLVWTSRNCKGGEKNPQEKPLEWLYKEFPGMTSKNTIILDDNPISFRENDNNAICIPEFKPLKGLNYDQFINDDQLSKTKLVELIMSNEDTCLGAVIKWFSGNHIIESDDLSSEFKPFNNS